MKQRNVSEKQIIILRLKFKPEFDSAAMEFDRAAVCFKNASELTRSREMYLKAAEMHLENGNIFHTAKCNENAAMVSKELGDIDSAMKLMEMAADGYAESGSTDTSAMALDKAAKFLEDVDPEKAIRIYSKGLTIVQQTDRSRMAGEFMNRITRLYLKLERYKEAADTISDEIEKYIEIKETGRVRQLTLALVLVNLAGGDSIAATKSMQLSNKVENFEISEEANACNALISAFESNDSERLQQIFQQPVLRSMDNEYLRLMKILKVNHVGGQFNGEEDGDEEDLK